MPLGYLTASQLHRPEIGFLVFTHPPSPNTVFPQSSPFLLSYSGKTPGTCPWVLFWQEHAVHYQGLPAVPTPFTDLLRMTTAASLFCLLHLYKDWLPDCFPGGSDCKECTCNAGYLDSVPQLGRSPGGGHGNPLQSSYKENSMDRGAWRATVHWVTKSWTQLSNQHFHFHLICKACCRMKYSAPCS